MATAPPQQTADARPPTRTSSRPRRSPFLSWLIVLVLFGGFATATYLVLRSGAEAGRGLPAYSVYSGDENGLDEAAAVLRRFGLHAVAVTRPIQQTRHRGLLLVVEPVIGGPLGPIPGMSKDDAVALLDWVGKGNALLLAGRQRTAVHDLLGVGLPGGAGGRDGPRLVEQIEFSGYTAGVEGLEVEGAAVVAPPGNAVPLWWLGDRPGAVVLPHGKGRVLVLPDPSLLTHRGLLRRDNVLFLYNVAAREARGGEVYFDEYHHGIRSGGGYWGYLQYHHQQWTVLQLLAVFAVGAWGVAVRLGPARPTPVTGQADAVDYASAVARIYQRAGVRHLLASFLVRDFLDALTALLHLKRSALPAEILAAWRLRHPDETSRARLQELLRWVGELRRAAVRQEAVSEASLLSWAQAFDGFLKEYRRSV